jgi:hypothetical protein
MVSPLYSCSTFSRVLPRAHARSPAVGRSFPAEHGPQAMTLEYQRRLALRAFFGRRRLGLGGPGGRVFGGLGCNRARRGRLWCSFEPDRPIARSFGVGRIGARRSFKPVTHVGQRTPGAQPIGELREQSKRHERPSALSRLGLRRLLSARARRQTKAPQRSGRQVHRARPHRSGL